MKRRVAIEILIWLIILIALFGGIFYVYSKTFVEPNVYNIQFGDIDGITKGSPVRFMGINVGYVRKLKPKNKYVDVQIIITKKDMKIPNGTGARVEFYGLGGSKSIELMPPDSSCDVGILTSDTIRINDVAQEAIGIVEIIEEMERYIKGINKYSVQKILETIVQTKDDKIKNVEKDLIDIEENVSEKLENVRVKQNEMSEKIKKVNENVEKINEFIKK